MNTPTEPSLAAVLPLHISGSYGDDDLSRTDILFSSLQAFAKPGTFSSILVVVPPQQVTQIEKALAKWRQLNISVVSEEALLPELARHRQVRGWRKQQLVKLGAYRALDSDFILTLDADVICLKPISKATLLPQGKALIQYELRSQHPKWWRSSARLLDTDGQHGDASIGMTITPAILARDLLQSVTDALTPDNGGTWVDRLCRLHNPRLPSNWTPWRFRRCKWTEYSLYYLNAMKQGLLERYHVDCGTADTPQRLITHDSHPFEQWDPANSFSDREPALFCIVGSKSGLLPSVVWDKVGDLITGSKASAAA
jgi:hypothetical protein